MGCKVTLWKANDKCELLFVTATVASVSTQSDIGRESLMTDWLRQNKTTPSSQTEIAKHEHHISQSNGVKQNGNSA